MFNTPHLSDFNPIALSVMKEEQGSKLSEVPTFDLLKKWREKTDCKRRRGGNLKRKWRNRERETGRGRGSSCPILPCRPRHYN